MKYEELDETDRKILRILQEDSTLTVKELAAKVNLSASPTFDRQKRLVHKRLSCRARPEEDGQRDNRALQHAPASSLAVAHG